MHNQDYKKHMHREKGRIYTQQCTICGAFMNPRNVISATSTGNHVVMDMFTMVHSCDSWIR
jgi:hypothetical protein